MGYFDNGYYSSKRKSNSTSDVVGTMLLFGLAGPMMVEGLFKGAIALTVSATIVASGAGYYYSKHAKETARYDEAYTLATKLVDKDNDGRLSEKEFNELYSLAVTTPTTYDVDSRKTKDNKLTLNDLEKVVLSHKN